jgi:hypothetical protein
MFFHGIPFIFLLAGLTIFGLFWKLNPVRASLLALFLGWALFPLEAYETQFQNERLPYWIYGMALPAYTFWNKAVCIGFAALCGTLCFQQKYLKLYSFRFFDLLPLSWILLPLLLSPFQDVNGKEAFKVSLYFFFVWGVPYFLGRLYIRDRQKLYEVCLASILLALFYVPLCMLEWITGPLVYKILYGEHPFRLDGIQRWLIYRPIGFLEHGNQLGIWMASASLLAVWLWKCGELRGIFRRWSTLIPLLLVGITLVNQSLGALVLLFLGLTVLGTLHWISWRKWGILFLCVLNLLLLFRTLGFALSFQEKRVFDPTSEYSLSEKRLESLAWRWRYEEQHLHQVQKHLWIGWGITKWWESEIPRPWGLTLLVLGRYGLVGLFLMTSCILLPFYRILQASPRLRWNQAPWNYTAGLALVLAINFLDALFNSTFNTVFLFYSGALMNLSYKPQS